MTDKKLLELPERAPQDSDNAYGVNGTSIDYRFTFSGLRTYLDGSFATNAELAAHTSDATIHQTSAETAAAIAGSGLVESAGTLQVGAGVGIDTSASAVSVEGAPTAKGQLWGFSGTAHIAIPAASGNGQVPVSDSSEASGIKWESGQFFSPTQATGDLIVRSGAADARLPAGATAGVALVSAGTGVLPVYGQVERAGIADLAVSTDQLGNQAATNAKLVDMPANTIKLRVATSGRPNDLTIEALADEPSPGGTDVLLAQKAGGDLIKIAVGNLPSGGGGEANLGANVGTGAAGSFRDKTGLTLNFRRLRSSDASVTITEETDTINLQAVAGGGDVTGPIGGVVVDELALYSDTTGKVIKGASGLVSTNLATLTGSQTYSGNKTLGSGGAWRFFDVGESERGMIRSEATGGGSFLVIGTNTGGVADAPVELRGSQIRSAATFNVTSGELQEAGARVYSLNNPAPGDALDVLTADGDLLTRAAGSYAKVGLAGAGKLLYTNGTNDAVEWADPGFPQLVSGQAAATLVAFANAAGEQQGTSIPATAVLRNDASATVGSAVGYAATTATQASGGTYTPNPENGQYVQLTGSTATTIAAMGAVGVVALEVPDGLTLDVSAYTETNTEPTGRAKGLILNRIGPTLNLATWL